MIFYHALRTRYMFFRQLGIDSVFCHLDSDGYSAGAADFFSVLRKKTAIRRLFLGANQTLGPGGQGNPEAIEFASRAFNIAITRIAIEDVSRVPTGLLIEANSAGTFEELYTSYNLSLPTRVFVKRRFREEFLLEGKYICYPEANSFSNRATYLSVSNSYGWFDLGAEYPEKTMMSISKRV